MAGRGSTGTGYATALSMKIGDAGVGHLASRKDLVWLELKGTQVTDAELEYLKGLTSLELLDLAYTSTTAQGVEKLPEALPKTGIVKF